MVEVPIFWKLIQRKVSPKPSIFFSNRDSKASGVTSRPVTPVPPVEITTSTVGSAIHSRSLVTIARTSSLTIARPASRWPSRWISSASALPDLSSASVRVSETVRTAIWTGWKGRLSSIRPAWGRLAVGGGESILRLIDRPAARRNMVEAGGGLTEALLVDPDIGHDAFHEVARLVLGQALHEQKRIAGIVCASPFGQRAR